MHTAISELDCCARLEFFCITDKVGIEALLFGLSSENLSRNNAESVWKEFAGSSVGHWCKIADL